MTTQKHVQDGHDCVCAAAGLSSCAPVNLDALDAIVQRMGSERRHLIPLLQAVQDEYNYLPPEALERLCEITGIKPAAVSGVATFFNQFRHKPTGRHLLKVCHGTACHVAGAQELTDAAGRLLELKDGEDTDAGMEFTVTKVACLGCCSLAPAVQIDDVTYGPLTPGTITDAIDDFRQQRDKDDAGDMAPAAADDKGKLPLTEFRISLISCCIASGSNAVLKSLLQSIDRYGARAVIRQGGCVGMCHRVPLLEVAEGNGSTAVYGNVTPEIVPEIVRRHTRSRNRLRRFSADAATAGEWLLYGPPSQTSGGFQVKSDDVAANAFLQKQKLIVLEGAGRLDPDSLEDYRRLGGFAALRQVLEMHDPQAVIRCMSESGLRGRGGAGFATGEKWKLVHAAEGDCKFIIGNGDEGDPGAFMDHMILESYPYRVLEGMIIAAFAVGADRGGLYVRAEYGLAARRIEAALAEMLKAGLLGDNILGSGYSLELELYRGAGAFVSGEETALIAAVEGRRATPRLRPPYPAVRGLNEQPTLINNVETFACVPWIIRNGPAAFAALGTENNRGTKVFALAGRINRGGLIEVPMGISIREIVEEIGGGIKDGRQFKAVQVGGPSGGCIPARLADVPVDYESILQADSIMGSGGLVVLDDRTCMVDVARYFLKFTQDESCGQCTFCRIGTKRMLEILERLCTGQGRDEDLEILAELAAQIKETSLCGLGRTAPNPVLSTLKHFRDEYLAHLAGRCPAGVCRDLITYKINDDCIGCTICVQKCPVGAIPPNPHEQHEINPELCIRCGTCRGVCPAEAVEVH